jgi:hypothetical protein
MLPAQMVGPAAIDLTGKSTAMIRLAARNFFQLEHNPPSSAWRCGPDRTAQVALRLLWVRRVNYPEAPSSDAAADSLKSYVREMSGV